MANFDLVKLALKATCPGNDILIGMDEPEYSR